MHAASARSENSAGGSRVLFSIVVPAFNEQEVLPQTFARCTAVGPKLAEMGFDYELIFVNDGSIDRTGELLNEYAQQDHRVRAVHLTRNFGHQAAVSAGLALARGQVIAVMDCDLQDPPEILPAFLDKWREGFAVVYAVRGKRREWFGKRLGYWAFYRLLAGISELDIPLDSGDFCVMDRRAVDLLNSLPESQRFVRGLRTWVGLRQTGIVYDRDERHAGRPAYTFKALRRLAMDGLVSFSSVPLRMVRRVGMLAGLVAVALGIAVVVARLARSNWFPPGWSSLACLILLATSAQLVSLGIIGEYLARIFIEVKRRPAYLIAEVVEQKQEIAPEPAFETLAPATAVSDSKPPAEEAATVQPAAANQVQPPEHQDPDLAAPDEVETPVAMPAAPTFYFVRGRREVLVTGIRSRVTALEGQQLIAPEAQDENQDA